MGRRRGKASTLSIIYWRDIPAQVTAVDPDGNHKALLEPRFQHAIDRAATVAGLTETHDYVNEWRKEVEPLTGDPAEVLAARAKAIDESYDRENLEALVANGGLRSKPLS